MSIYQDETKRDLSDLIIWKGANSNSFKSFLKIYFHFIPTKTVHFLTFYNYFNLPMFISEQTFIGLFQNSHSVNLDKMIFKLIDFYCGDLEERINNIIAILDFDRNGIINIDDIKNFFRHFNSIGNNETVQLLDLGNEIIDKGFGCNTKLSLNEFKNMLLNDNCDIFYLFSIFYSHFLFFDYKCYQYYEKQFYSSTDCFITNTDEELLLHKNYFFLDQLPQPTESLLEYLNLKFNTNFVIDDDLKVLDTFESEVKETISIIQNLSSIKINCPSRKIQTETNLSSFQKSGRSADKSTKVQSSQSNYSLKQVSLFMNKPKELQSFQGDWYKNDTFVKYNIDILENVIYISSKNNELKIMFSTHQLYLEMITNPDDELVRKGKGKIPLAFLSTLTNNIKKCVLYFDNKITIERIIKIVNKTKKYQPIDHTRFIDQIIIDHGSFGQIIKSYDCVYQKEIAIKAINKKYEDLENLKMIRNEQDISFFLKNHSNKGIVEIYDVFESKDTVYIIEELIPNGNLKDYLLNNHPNDSEKDIIIHQLVDSICFLHSNNIVHRDLKLENILVDNSSVPIQTKIIDFGLSKIFTINEKMQEKYGTLLYLPPEIILNDRYSYKIDIWLFGIIAYTILNEGIHPFAEETEVEHLLQKIIAIKFDYSKFSVHYQYILKSCLVKEKDRVDIHRVKKMLEL